MKPVKSNITETSEACTPISSNCVVWQGPDIPCLNLCSGDSVTDVVYKLGTLFCEISDATFNVTNIDLTCLLAGGGTAPATRDEFYQLIVDKLCEALVPTDPTDPTSIYFNLPTCLQYVDGDGNTVMMAELPDYVDLIGNAVCDIQAAIALINTDIQSLDARVTILENATPGATSFPTVTTQCASGPVPGITLPIQQAFYNLETKFCALHAVLGTIPQLNATILTECTDLDTAPTLMDDELQMQDIPGWVVTPTTLAENVNNIWLTLCDMRSKIIECCGVPVIPCAPVSVGSVTVGGITLNSALVSWTTPSFGTGEPPTEYLVEVYNWSGGVQGSLALSPSQYVPYPLNATTLNTSSLIEDKEYLVKVTAIYSCGSAAPMQVVSPVRTSAASLCLYVFDTPAGTQNSTCLTTNYSKENKFIYVRLQNASSNPVVNVGTTITVNVTMNITGACSGPATENIQLTIPYGQSQGMATYTSFEKVNCSGTCQDVTRSIGCVESITGTTVTLCAAGPDLCVAP